MNKQLALVVVIQMSIQVQKMLTVCLPGMFLLVTKQTSSSDLKHWRLTEIDPGTGERTTKKGEKATKRGRSIVKERGSSKETGLQGNEMGLRSKETGVEGKIKEAVMMQRMTQMTHVLEAG